MENSKPFIALTPYHNLEKDEPYMRPAYLSAVREAGGIPVILPLEPEEADLPQLVNAFDGFLFTGGPDLHPLCFPQAGPFGAYFVKTCSESPKTGFRHLQGHSAY